MPSLPMCYFVKARLPASARIVAFPGGPNLDDIMVDRRSKRVAPFPTRWQILRATFSDTRVDNSSWLNLQRYGLPVPWIEEFWRD